MNLENNRRPAVFLDRDGTINVDKDYLYRPKDIEYIDGAVDGMRTLCNAGYLLVIITNQSGIARGYYTEDDYLTLTMWLLGDLKNLGVEIAGNYHCPHHPEGIIKKYAINCACRKPQTKLFWDAAKDLSIDMEKSFAIGDRMRDLSICKEAGVQGILLDNGRCDEKYLTNKIKVCESWIEIKNYILSNGKL